MSVERRNGLILVLVAMALWSLAGFFVRLADVALWDLILWRSLFACGALVLIVLLRPSAHGGTFGWAGLCASAIAAVSMASYAAALTLTSVANVLIVYATLPFVTAALAFALLCQHSSRRTLAAASASLAGVAIVAAQSLQPSDVGGNALALLMTVTFAALLLLARHVPGLDLARVNALAAFLCALAAFPLSSGTIPDTRALALLAALGILTTAFAFLLYLMGARHLPPAEAALFGLLDVILGPLWVWLAFAEHPGAGALTGGAIVLVSVVWYLLPSIRTHGAARARACSPAPAKRARAR